MPADPAELPRASAALHDQWRVLRPWVRALLDDVPDLAARPSVLAGWSVADLVAHVGRAMNALTAVTPAPPGTAPLTLRRYLGGYAAGAATIAENTRVLAADIAADPFVAVDRMVGAAFDHLAALGPGDRVVVARRGPITLSDMVTSRVVELVVHADDLARSVPGRGAALLDPGALEPGALEPGALDLVAEALAVVLRDAGGPRLRVADPVGWVRLATGRVAADAEAVVRVAPPSGPGSAADVVRLLPLL